MSEVFALDLDGTLVGCRDRQVAVATAVAARRGVRFDPDVFWEAKRGGAPTAPALVHAGAGVAEAELIARGWHEAIEDPTWLALDTLDPGARAAIERIRATGLEPAVLTARRDADAVAEQVEALGLDMLTVVVDPAEADTQKALVLREWRAAAFVGDTESDALAAQGAGVPFAGVAGGQRSRDFLIARGVRRVFDAVGDAVDALLAEWSHRGPGPERPPAQAGGREPADHPEGPG